MQRVQRVQQMQRVQRRALQRAGGQVEGASGAESRESAEQRVQSREGVELPQPLEPAHEQLRHALFREASQQLVPIGLRLQSCRISSFGRASWPLQPPIGPWAAQRLVPCA